MKTVYDVQQLLKKYGTFIYTRDRVADLELMEEEIMELHRSELLQPAQFKQALLLLRREIREEKVKRAKKKTDNK